MDLLICMSNDAVRIVQIIVKASLADPAAGRHDTVAAIHNQGSSYSKIGARPGAGVPFRVYLAIAVGREEKVAQLNPGRSHQIIVGIHAVQIWARLDKIA